MKKLLLVFTSIVLFAYSFLSAGIIGGSCWVKEDKKVMVYFDTHDAGSAEENQARIDYINHHVFDRAAARVRPLTVLVENYMRDPALRVLVRQLEHHSGDDVRFLQLFDAYADRDFGHNVLIKSIDARVVPFLTFKLFCEWKRIIGGRPSLLPGDLYRFLDRTFAGITFEGVFALANQIDEYISQAPSEAARNMFQDQKAAMLKVIREARAILTSGGFSSEELRARPIKQLIVDMQPSLKKRKTWDFLFIDYKGQDFWPTDLLWQLTNAHILWEIIHAPGDVAIFTGSYHAVAMEGYLEELGYVQRGVVGLGNVEHERGVFSGDVPYNDDPKRLVECNAFDWMR